MPTYVEYKNEDGTTVLIETESTGPVTRGPGGVSVVQSSKSFMDAWGSVRSSMQALSNELDMLKVEEAVVEFGLKAVGELGNVAIGKMGGEMNYKVTLRWKKPPETTNAEGKK